MPIKLTSFPEYAKIIKGSWLEEKGKVWCKIIESNKVELSLSHPTKGEFAWVDKEDCIFASEIDKKSLSLFKKDGIYVFKNGKQICYGKDTSDAYSQIEKIIGRWSMKTAETWCKYIFVEYNDGIEIDSFTY